MSSHPRLGVNIDHVATLRQARGTPYPDPIFAASLAEQAGAGQITVHLREDRRHIQDRDVMLLKQTLHTLMNLEMAGTDEMVAIACQIRPHVVTLVPEKRHEVTTEGGLQLTSSSSHAMRDIIQTLHDHGIEVSLFIDPEPSMVEHAHHLGAKTIELHTGTYCEATHPSERAHELARIAHAANLAQQAHMRIAAGHGLHYHNIQPLLALPAITEYNIGHSIVARAVFVGFAQAVADMVRILQNP